MASYGMTYGNSVSGYTFTLGSGERPADPPSGLIVTRAVQTKRGWRGQVIIDTEIVHETKALSDKEDAIRQVNRFVVNRVKQLFAPTPSRSENDDEDA